MTAPDTGETSAEADATRSVATPPPPAASRPERGVGVLERGACVDRYVILDLLGQGGMGVVYRAYDPELDRRIALKLVRVKSGASAATQRIRLQREAQALAQLSHPNVIAVYDVGTFHDDVFIAIELAEGKSMKAWLAEDRPSQPQILQAFLAAGRGLAAAHRADLVHRDFKPANVIIGNDGRVRVLDFGLARPVELGDASADPRAAGTPPPSSSDTTLDEPASPASRLLTSPLTQAGSIVGTPAYMAPEQASLQEVGPASDQFSFCVALFEALYGTRPFSKEQRWEMLRPYKPHHAPWLPEVPDTRQVAPWLRRIVLRGLSTLPSQRYPSMDALLAELSRDETSRRRRALVAAGAVATALVAALAIGALRASTDAPPPCRDSRRHLAGVWDPAARAQLRAAFVATGRSSALDTYQRVERELDRYTDRWVRMRTEACEATNVRREQSPLLMDRRMSCLDQRLGELRALTAVLADRPDGAVLDNAVSAAIGLPGLATCADQDALLAAYPPPADPQVRARVTALDEQLDRAGALRSAGKYQAARDQAARVVAQTEALAHAPLAARARLLLGVLEDDLGEVDASVSALQAALRDAAIARDDTTLARAWVELVWGVGYARRDHAAALTLASAARTAIVRAGDDQELVARLESHLGVAAWAANRLDEARQHHERALAIREQRLGPGHPDVAKSLTNLGSVHYKRHRYDLAQPYFERALAISEQVLGPDHPEIGREHENLGANLQALGRDAEAQVHAERALAIFTAALGPDHLAVATTLTNLAIIRWHQGHPAEALPLHERAFAIYDAALDDTDPSVTASLLDQADCLLDLQRAADALARAGQALAVLEAPAAVATDRARAQFTVARALRATGGDPARARALADEADRAYAAAGEPWRQQRDRIARWLAAR